MASISTPVRSTVSTWASTSTWRSSIRKFTKTDPTRSGWHNGRRLGVCLAAWMPATRATANTSPFVMAPDAIFVVVSGSMCTRQRATARRCVASFDVTSTMRARPSGSRWVNSDADTRCAPGGKGKAPPADLAHGAAGTHEVDLPDAVPGPFRPHRPLDLGRQSVVDLTVPGGVPGPAEDRAEVELLQREQARAELAL